MRLVAPVYAPAGGAALPRDGRLLDLDVSQGLALRRDSRGGLGAAGGTDRLISRLLRALDTELGAWWADPTYGSLALPGLTVAQNLAVKLTDVVLQETRRYMTGRVLPATERVSKVVVTAAQLVDDPRQVQVDIVLYDATGAAFPARFAF